MLERCVFRRGKLFRYRFYIIYKDDLKAIIDLNVKCLIVKYLD